MPTKKDEVSNWTKLEKLRHENKMKEIEFECKCKKEVESQKFEHMMSRERLKNANIQRNQARKDFQYGNKTY